MEVADAGDELQEGIGVKALVYHKYGSPDVLRLEEVEKPAPKDDEVLIQVHAASVNDWDWGLLRGGRDGGGRQGEIRDDELPRGGPRH